MAFDSVLAVALLGLMLALGCVFARQPASEFQAKLSKALFRSLVVAGLVAGIYGAAQAVLIPGLRDDQLASYRDTFSPDQYEGRHALRVALFLIAAVAVAASTPRMVLARRDARPAYFASVFALMAVTELLRPYVHPGYGEEWCELGFLLSIAAVGFAYLSPVRRWYAPPVPA